MKTASKTGISFGFSAVNAGQRNTTAEPQVIVVSTEGNFRITPAVSKVLGIAHGDNVMFLSNVKEIDEAIVEKNEELAAFCEENGLELGSPEALVAIHKEFDTWGIAKGVAEFDTKGNAKTASERLSAKDKAKFVSANFDDMLERALNEADEETVSALSRDGITKEEQIDLLSAFVTPRQLPKFTGSKAANPAQLTGSGVSLTFTDSNVWKQIKVDLGEEATKVNRIYDVDVEDIQTVDITNGYETVSIKVLVLADYTDKEPMRIGAKGEEEVED